MIKIYDVYHLNESEDYYASFSNKQQAVRCIEKFNNLYKSIGSSESLDSIIRIREVDDIIAEDLRMSYCVCIRDNRKDTYNNMSKVELTLTPQIVNKTYEEDKVLRNGIKLFFSEDIQKVLNNAILWLKKVDIAKDSLRFMCASRYSRSSLFSSNAVREYIQNNWDKL